MALAVEDAVLKHGMAGTNACSTIFQRLHERRICMSNFKILPIFLAMPFAALAHSPVLAPELPVGAVAPVALAIIACAIFLRRR